MAEKKEKRYFTGSNVDSWDLTKALNELVPYEECGFELDEIGKEYYNEDLELIKRMRKKDPDFKVSYKSSYID